jgi:hypothetical protein
MEKIQLDRDIYIYSLYRYIIYIYYVYTCIIGKQNPAPVAAHQSCGMLRRSPQPSGQRQSIQHGGISRGNMATPKAHSLQNWISEDTFFEETTWKETKKPCKLYGLTYDWHLFSMNFNSHIMIISLISHGHGDGFSWIYSLTG